MKNKYWYQINLEIMNNARISFDKEIIKYKTDYDKFLFSIYFYWFKPYLSSVSRKDVYNNLKEITEQLCYELLIEKRYFYLEYKGE